MTVKKCSHPPYHEMIEVVGGLRVCECSAYGTLQHLKGAVEEARRLIMADGGYDAVRERIHREAKQKRDERKKQRELEQKQYMIAGKARWVE